jgi:hypothetical protein
LHGGRLDQNTDTKGDKRFWVGDKKEDEKDEFAKVQRVSAIVQMERNYH